MLFNMVTPNCRLIQGQQCSTTDIRKRDGLATLVIYILSSVEHTGSKHCPTCAVIMLMNSILFMRIITIASCAMFVSGLFKITEPKIVYSIE